MNNMTNEEEIRFKIRYLKSYLKHSSCVLRENKTIANVQARLSTEWYKVIRNLNACHGDRQVAQKKLNDIEAEMKSFYKSSDIDIRFDWNGSLLKQFPHYIYWKDGDKHRSHTISSDSKVTGAHILYNRLRGRPSHIRDTEKEHEYNHELTYWSERLAFLQEEECSRKLSPKDFISPRDGVGECGDGVVGTNAHGEGEGSHG
jgi:hypothetical protein